MDRDHKLQTANLANAVRYAQNADREQFSSYIRELLKEAS